MWLSDCEVSHLRSNPTQVVACQCHAEVSRETPEFHWGKPVPKKAGLECDMCTLHASTWRTAISVSMTGSWQVMLLRRREPRRRASQTGCCPAQGSGCLPFCPSAAWGGGGHFSQGSNLMEIQVSLKSLIPLALILPSQDNHLVCGGTPGVLGLTQNKSVSWENALGGFYTSK